jgi:hypothetical protein
MNHFRSYEALNARGKSPVFYDYTQRKSTCEFRQFKPNLIFQNQRRPSVCNQPQVLVNDDSYDHTDQTYAHQTRGHGEHIGYCVECKSYSYLVKCRSHCDQLLCDLCQKTHWKDEIQELLKYKCVLESKVDDIRNYLGA